MFPKQANKKGVTVLRFSARSLNRSGSGWICQEFVLLAGFTFFFFSFGAFNCLAFHIKNGCADLKSQFLHRFIVFGISCISYLQRQLEEHVIQHKCQAVPNSSSLYPSQRELLDYISAYRGSTRKAGVEPCLLITVSLFSALKYINKWKIDIGGGY